MGSTLNSDQFEFSTVGFSTPMGAFGKRSLDLHQLVVEHPAATFFMRVGRSYQDLGIGVGDLLVIDRSLKPVKNSHIVVVSFNGELKLVKWGVATNLDSRLEILVWGVVTFVIRALNQ